MIHPLTKVAVVAGIVTAAAVSAVAARNAARLASRHSERLCPDPKAASALATPLPTDSNNPRQAVGGPASARRGRVPCRLGRATAWLPQDTAAEVRLIVADRSIPSRAAAQLLGDIGVQVSHQTVNRHRNKALPPLGRERPSDQCGCPTAFVPER